MNRPKALLLVFCSFFYTLSYAQNFGIGEPNPVSKLDVSGNLTVGEAYAGVHAAPAGGALFEGTVGVGTPTPNANAILDISATDKGIMGPRMDGAARATLGGLLGADDHSMLVYDTDAAAYYFWDGTQWKEMGADTLWTKDDNRVFLVDSDDMVGIGTNTPGSKLGVAGGAAVGSGFAGSAAPDNGLLVQGSVGVGTPTPSPKAILDLSSSDLGFLPPRMTTAQREALQTDPNPDDEGMLVYDTDAQAFFYWDGDEWKGFGGGTGLSPISNVTGIVVYEHTWGGGTFNMPSTFLVNTNRFNFSLTDVTAGLGVPEGAACIISPNSNWQGYAGVASVTLEANGTAEVWVRKYGNENLTGLNAVFQYVFIW